MANKSINFYRPGLISFLIIGLLFIPFLISRGQGAAAAFFAVLVVVGGVVLAATWRKGR